MSKQRNQVSAPRAIRCAIYTRKSTEEGLEQEFNSLDAQRESGEAYVKSQAHEGWTCLPDRYDDGGFTGGNMDRPALGRLIADIAAGRVDCVVVYKVDRLSRSLLDFTKIMETFDKQQVSFVSVTQQFNTTTSMGRLMLNVLLSFAQFEREIIGERTRDKIAAARRKGKWAGGMPLLGYDVVSSKLVINEAEAVRVRTIFALYLEHEALLPVVQELERRGWTNKRWTTRKGTERGGKRFTKTSLYALLTNVTYAGKVRHKKDAFDGAHHGLIDPALWQKVQPTLSRNGQTGGALVRNKFGALLKGILRCSACDCAMSPTHTNRKGNRRYRYYVCTQAQKRGWNVCPTKSVSAGEIEAFVVERIRTMGHNPELLRETLAQAQRQSQQRQIELKSEQESLKRDLRHWNDEVMSLAQAPPLPKAIDRLADLQERIRTAECRFAEIRAESATLDGAVIDDASVAECLQQFDPAWQAMTPHEQCSLVQRLLARVDLDRPRGKITLHFQPAGLRLIADEMQLQTQGVN